MNSRRQVFVSLVQVKYDPFEFYEGELSLGPLLLFAKQRRLGRPGIGDKLRVQCSKLGQRLSRVQPCPRVPWDRQVREYAGTLATTGLAVQNRGRRPQLLASGFSVYPSPRWAKGVSNPEEQPTPTKLTWNPIQPCMTVVMFPITSPIFGHCHIEDCSVLRVEGFGLRIFRFEGLGFRLEG